MLTVEPTEPALSRTTRVEPWIGPRGQVLLLVLLLLLGAGVRLFRVEAPGVLIDREYNSAILARDFYFGRSDTVEPWRKAMARQLRENQRGLELPVTEWLVSWVYTAVGGERLWCAHLVTSFFWLAGALLLYAWLRALGSVEGALAGTAFYLLSPFAILVSRSFQPDSLMMLLFLGALLGIARYWQEPTLARLLAAAAVSGSAVLYRPIVTFALMGAFLAGALQRHGVAAVLGRRVLLYIGAGLLPALVYYGHATFIAGHFGWQVQSSFQPWLLTQQEFWAGWFTLATDAIGFPMAAAALLGAPLLYKGLPQATMAGLAAGYAVFGLLFTMHIHTHGYYHAQLLPLTALAAGPVIALIVGRVRETVDRWWLWVAPVALLLVLGAASAREVRSELGAQRFESPAVAREIGDLVQHSSRVVFLAPYYGMPLQYHGEFTGAYWPRSVTYYLERRGAPALTIDERLANLGFAPEYFVITDFSEFDRNHADLQEYLPQHWTLVADTKQYRIYRPRAYAARRR
jgi:hypothetical protein